MEKRIDNLGQGIFLMAWEGTANLAFWVTVGARAVGLAALYAGLHRGDALMSVATLAYMWTLSYWYIFDERKYQETPYSDMWMGKILLGLSATGVGFWMVKGYDYSRDTFILWWIALGVSYVIHRFGGEKREDEASAKGSVP